MKNPYEATTKVIDFPAESPAFRWGRVFLWAVSIYVAAIVLGFSSGLSMGYWEIYGDTLQEAITNARLVRRIAIGVVGVFLYTWFVAGLASRRLLHTLTLFGVVQLMELCVSLLLGDALRDWFDPWSIGRSLLAASIGFAIGYWGFKRSVESTPPRVAA
jgi:hypothetical protein